MPSSATRSRPCRVGQTERVERLGILVDRVDAGRDRGRPAGELAQHALQHRRATRFCDELEALRAVGRSEREQRVVCDVERPHGRRDVNLARAVGRHERRGRRDVLDPQRELTVLARGERHLDHAGDGGHRERATVGERDARAQLADHRVRVGSAVVGRRLVRADRVADTRLLIDLGARVVDLDLIGDIARDRRAVGVVQRDASGAGREEPIVRLTEHRREADLLVLARGERDLVGLSHAKRAARARRAHGLDSGLEDRPWRDVLDPQLERARHRLGHVVHVRIGGTCTEAEGERGGEELVVLHVRTTPS